MSGFDKAVKDKTDDELRAIVDRIQKELESRDEAASQAENSKLVGKCFVTRNCYSCPEKRSDCWNVYSMVLSLSDGGGLNVLKFQTDSRGGVFVQTTYSYRHCLGKKISREVFDKAAGKLVMKVAESLMISVQPG